MEIHLALLSQFSIRIDGNSLSFAKSIFDQNRSESMKRKGRRGMPPITSLRLITWGTSCSSFSVKWPSHDPHGPVGPNEAPWGNDYQIIKNPKNQYNSINPTLEFAEYISWLSFFSHAECSSASSATGGPVVPVHSFIA